MVVICRCALLSEALGPHTAEASQAGLRTEPQSGGAVAGHRIPQIQARAKQEKTEIYWGDETGSQNDAYNAKGFAPKGRTPVVRINAPRAGSS